ncbi:MAG: hypothetical protein ABJG29_07575, partial [Marinomonas sp.]
MIWSMVIWASVSLPVFFLIQPQRRAESKRLRVLAGVPYRSADTATKRRDYRRRNMAGHSKWANIQHRKGRQDAARSKLF